MLSVVLLLLLLLCRASRSALCLCPVGWCGTTRVLCESISTLTSTRAIVHRTLFVLCKPITQMFSMTAMTTVLTPTEPTAISATACTHIHTHPNTHTTQHRFPHTHPNALTLRPAASAQRRPLADRQSDGHGSIERHQADGTAW